MYTNVNNMLNVSSVMHKNNNDDDDDDKTMK